MRFLSFPLLLLVPATAHAADAVDYRKDVKPVLQERCYACHGALAQKAKLRVDSGENLRNAGVIVPGKPGDSELIIRIASDNDATRMPPEGHPLKPEQIAKIKTWIEQGAKVPADDKPEADPRDHWSFRKPVRPAPPAIDVADFTVRNPIDQFIAAKWPAKLKPVSPADKRVLLRRVYLDLIGLPPTAAQMDAFLKDPAPDAYEKVVDGLLASPQYGERWGRHFLDIWRYSDWWGLGAELRNSQRHIWHWRDWTVESFNSDLGYDEMIRQMLAADELYSTDPQKLRATGYLARPYFLFNRTTWLDEVMEHTGKGFLGLTFNCAKCHDHKYDPIKQTDYYSFRAIFEPYQLRTDLLPGELDAMKAGIPRAFDANLSAKTPFHIRGDERNPDKDRVVNPGLPQFLAPDGFKPTPVKLPVLAYRPGARPEIVAAYRKAAEAKLESAKAALASAQSARAKIAKTDKPKPNDPAKPKTTEGKLIFKDDFAKANPDVWEVGPGMWKHEKGKLLQQKPDGDRSHIRTKSAPPTDFEAKFNFTITGGNPYRSVGIAFDVGEGNEVLVYVSAGGNKLQVAYKNGANYVYPANSAINMPIPVNKPLELLVRVRGTLLNVSLNGEHKLAYTLPIARKAGKLDLITYTATAAFTGFTLRELPKEIALVQPGTKPGAVVLLTPEIAEANVLAAEKAVAAAEAEIASIDARAKADASGAKDDAKTAAKAEKLAGVANAVLTLAQAEVAVKRAPTDPKALQTRKSAETALTAAKKSATNPGETYTPLPGAVKTQESNLDAKGKTGPFPDTSTGRRSALANWIASKDNPLTARVAVNHLWLRHFGRPLVANVFEFGRRGTAPSHPELLDWLAVEFMEHKWSLKHLHKLMVTSNTYRLSSSSANADVSEKLDPENRYFWRMNSTRMDANVIRDSLLHLAGDLDLTPGGPPVPLAQQDASRRRAMYFFHSHNEHNKLLDIFDNANVLDCYRRTESIVPQQALALWNSKLAQTMAAKINDHLNAKLKDDDDTKFVTAAFETVLGTSPTKDELATCLEAIAELRAELKAVPVAEQTKRVRLQVVQALVNHNDFVTVR